MSSYNGVDLNEIARNAMRSRGFLVEFPPAVVNEANIAVEPPFDSSDLKDLSHFFWSSIDNDDSKDLDQLEFSQELASGVRVFVAIADVNCLVSKGSATDIYARDNTTSVYTGVEIFPMLPQRFSTDLTSLNEGKKRRAVVIEMEVSHNGVVDKSSVYQAVVQNKAQLTYNAVSIWLENSPPPYSDITTCVIEKIKSSPELQQQLLQQDKISKILRTKRQQDGALDFRTAEITPTFSADGQIELKSRQADRASHIIEEFMIASNESVDAFLSAKKFPCLQRVVRTPKNWPRMVELASQHGGSLPPEPNALALQNFLAERQASDPAQYMDLSLAMIKLLGRGEYVVKFPSEVSIGHFGLAVSNYSHTTAPNRRYPDLITQRLLVSAFKEEKPLYSKEELDYLASHCTQKEDDANRVERQVKKSMAAVALSSSIGMIFSGIITGASDKGIFVRVSNPPVEGKVEGNTKGLDVGEEVQVKLVHTDPYRGFIDFQVIAGRSIR